MQNKNINNLEELVNKLKKKNKIVGLCHGVFDLIHLGHIEHFKECKSSCDYLIVSLTSDKFIEKGIGRPYFNEIERKCSLEAIKFIDHVLINNELTSINLIKKIKPSIYFKGIDYKKLKNDKTGNILKEKNSIESVGGNIYFTTSKKYSSSILLNNQNLINQEHLPFINKIKKQITLNKLMNKIDKIESAKVLLIGEIILDKYSYAEPLGKAGKDPIMTFKNVKSEIFPGGTLAIANDISNFCKKVDIITYTGDNKDELKNLKINKNIKIFKFRKKNSPTLIKTRFIDKDSQKKIIGFYDINDDEIDLQTEKNILKLIEKKIKHYDLVIVADYGHGLITNNIIKKITTESNFLSVNTQLNSANFGFHTISKYKKANLLCMHEGELRQDLRMKNEDIKHVIKSLSKKIKSNNIIVTRGQKGAIAYSNNKYTDFPAFKTKIIDKVGAGDSFFGIISLCNYAKFSNDINLLIGNICGYLSVSSIGNSKNIKKKDLYVILKNLFL